MIEGSNLYGEYHVTPTTTAIKEAMDLFPRYRDYQEARKHALKLAYWPSGGTPEGKVIDLDWEEITAMPDPKAYELRIDDTIGGMNNLRVIFYAFPKKIVLQGDVMPRIWTIGVMQKKTQRFSNRDLRIFSGRVKIIRQRHYIDYL
jgi:hypothetical protein